MKKCLILANGKLPKKSDIKYLQKAGYSTLICADGGANSAKKLGFAPDFIIGDFDSVSPDTLKYFENKSVVKKITRQNDTDVEKALKLAIKKKFTNAILLGATGDRIDHLFCNIGIVLKFYPQIDVSILHDKTLMKPYTGKVELNTEVNETISLYGIDAKTKITSSGLKYPLKNIPLPFGKRESTSNVALKDKVQLKITGGIILIVRDISVLKRNDFFRHS